MSTDLTIRQDTLVEKIEWSRAMAPASLLPKQYRDNPGNLLFAVEYADALGIERINAITSIHVIDGKPSASADLIAGLIRRAGHKLRVMGDDTYAEAHLIRADDPEFTYVARWDLDKARVAGLLGKNTWKNYPGALLRSRAITEVGRMGASDALFGVVYTPEELGAETDATGAPVNPVALSGPPPSGRDRMRGILHAEPDPEQAHVVVVKHTTVDPEPDPISSSQLKRIGDLLSEVGVTDRQKAREFLSETVDRVVTARADLSADEAVKVISALEAVQVSGEDPWAPVMRTDAQSTRLHAAMSDLGIVDRDAKLRYCSDVIGRAVETTKSLTLSEASQVIDALARDAGQPSDEAS